MSPGEEILTTFFRHSPLPLSPTRNLHHTNYSFLSHVHHLLRHSDFFLFYCGSALFCSLLTWFLLLINARQQSMQMPCCIAQHYYCTYYIVSTLNKYQLNFLVPVFLFFCVCVCIFFLSVMVFRCIYVETIKFLYL